ncbi:TRAP-type C4-dicarboxylate transport system, substrate-binding protein [Methylobacterium sp. 174MFSha1.1]|uniref:TRAP transporter substrate-binding protein n=1 Tax=Methylobacterium sp. 174MFSha1.1 TaxID=1502749 RepID=UPI0008EAC467|nr:TRAP transporter substrate-binding protein [Methylobacterium sp. 174MFSha1.1]SFU61552.1 TRAP-type C4-dicarboxylate transport system, substrate-binding protein [Methylobacterium sp. 174MFSha1.1]
MAEPPIPRCAGSARPTRHRFRRRGRVAACLTALAAAVVLVLGLPGARAGEPVRLTVVGGLAGVSQYRQLEQPFWQTEIGERTGGRLTVSIRPFNESGLRGEDMLQLMRLGVVPFGTALLAVAAGDEPELNAVDLPALNPDMTALRQNVGHYREHLREVLRERYGIELLGIYAYPAQVLFCTRKFEGLADLAGRRIRTSSVGQSELMAALGAMPVIIPFAETVAALRDGVADCAITGTLSGYEIGLSGVATHVHAMAISWGMSFFGANIAAWRALPADLRDEVRRGVADLEQRIWKQAEDDTARGLACATQTACPGAPRKAMTLVPLSPRDAERRQRLLTETVLPRWIERCGEACVGIWNETLKPALGVTAKAE